MAKVFIAFGSNLGDRRANIDSAITSMRKSGINVFRSSTIIETDPVGGPTDQGKFFNGVVVATTDLSPRELLETLLSIEHSLGRIRGERNGPRPIDLDILLYDNVVLSSDNLIIPHPRMIERDFVMIPFKEIAPKHVMEFLHACH